MSKPPIIREESPDDIEVVRRLVGSAYGGEKVPELLDALRESVGWLDLSFVLEQKNEVVAHVCYSRGWLDAAERLVEVLVLSPLAVRPDRHRTGLGSLLVKETLKTLEGHGEPLVFVEGDPGYYSRLGFVAGDMLHFTAPSVRIPEPAFQVATLPGYDQSWMSGALVYPDVWWRHDCVGLRPET